MIRQGVRYLTNVRRTASSNIGHIYSRPNFALLSAVVEEYNGYVYCTRRFSTLHEQFEQAKNKLNQLREDPGNDKKLKLYALYKQATVGHCNAPKPGIMDFVGKAKWEAWNSLGELPQEEAKTQYVQMVSELTKEQGVSSDSADPSPKSSGEYDGFFVTKETGVATITLNRPNRKNSLTKQMYFDIPKALKEIADDDNILVAVLTGNGDYFSSGNDLSNFTNLPPGVDPKSLAVEAGEFLRKYVASYIDFPKPLIAAVNGPALGISVTVLGLFDAVYASEKATFQTPFTSLAQSPEGCSSFIFPRIMGFTKANELLLLNRKITASEAKELNLVTEVFSADKFQDEVNTRVLEMAKLPKKSVIYTKKLVRDPHRDILHKVNQVECEQLVERWLSPELVEVLMKFFQRKGSPPKL